MTALSPTEPSNGVAPNAGSLSPRQTATPKSVAFELLFTDSPQYRARLPMRVQIYPHDTTDSIVTTVKNFYGLYSSPTCSKGVSFEDEQSNTLIARYENFRNNMVVYVRVIEEPAQNPAEEPHVVQETSSSKRNGFGLSHNTEHTAITNAVFLFPRKRKKWAKSRYEREREREGGEKKE